METLCNILCYLTVIVIIYKILDRLIRIPRLKSNFQRNVIVTGCDSGFGFEFCKRMDRDGYRIFAACLTEQGKEKLNKETSDKVVPFLMNIADEKSIQNGLHTVTSMLSSDEGIWALLNNAGINGRCCPTEWLQHADYLEVFNVNIFGTVNVCRHFIPLIRKCKGRIINTSSIVGRIAFPGGSAYTWSKYAVEGFSDVLRREMLKFGISVHLVEPGLFRTPIVAVEKNLNLFLNTYERLSEEMKEIYGGKEGFEKESQKLSQILNVCSVNWNPVLNSYEHAVTAVYPRVRYMPGWTAWLILWPISLLPEWISDKILSV